MTFPSPIKSNWSDYWKIRIRIRRYSGKFNFERKPRNSTRPGKRIHSAFIPTLGVQKMRGKQYGSAYLAGNGAQADMLLHDLIKTRYMLVIELIHLLNMKKLNNELMIGYDDSVHVLKESVDSPDFDITDYINIKNSFTDTRLELVKINNDITSINNDILRCLESGGIIKETDPDFIRFDTSYSDWNRCRPSKNRRIPVNGSQR